MLSEYFWKALFAIIVGAGCMFWLKSASAKKAYKRHVGQLASYLDMGPDGAPKSEEEAGQRVFRAIAELKIIDIKKGKKFKLRETLAEACAAVDTDSYVSDVLVDVFEENYLLADKLGLLDDEDALFYMQDGSRAKITTGAWSGQYAEAGFYIPPSIAPSLANNLCNRTILPETVHKTLSGGEMSKTVYEHAAKLHKRAKLLDLSDFEEISSEYNLLRKEMRR